jgi:TPR repeat protein
MRQSSRTISTSLRARRVVAGATLVAGFLGTSLALAEQSPARAAFAGTPAATTTATATATAAVVQAVRPVLVPAMGRLTRDGLTLLRRGSVDGEPSCHAAGRLFLQACKAGDAVGCRMMASLYTTGTALIVRDAQRAAELLGRACTGGDALACQQLGVAGAATTAMATTTTRR